LDAGLFRKEIRSKLDLRSILDTLRKNSLVGFYMYTFSVDKSGKVRPFIYFNGKTDNLGEIQTYVASTFNYYKWKPGYRKKCMKCKAKLLMRLTISYEDDESRIEVYIEYLEDRYKKEIFSMNIPYSQLKTFK
jgi:hypothetical protein